MFILFLFMEILQAILKVHTLHDKQKYTRMNTILRTAVKIKLKSPLLQKETGYIFTSYEA